VATGGAPAERVNDAGKLKCGSQKASEVRVAFRRDAVGGRSNPRQQLPQVRWLRGHAAGDGPHHLAKPLDGGNHIPSAGANEAGLVEETQHISKRRCDLILVILVHFPLH
jgi:hypothetical protein